MAATQLAPAAASANITAVTNPVLNAFHDVLAQIGRGITTPTVSLTGVTEHGSAAVELWKSIVE